MKERKKNSNTARDGLNFIIIVYAGITRIFPHVHTYRLVSTPRNADKANGSAYLSPFRARREEEGRKKKKEEEEEKRRPGGTRRPA